MSNDLPSIRQAMLQSLEGGQFHVRERMAGSAQLPYEDFVQIGLALRACYFNSSRHDELIEVNHLMAETGGSVEGQNTQRKSS